MRLLLDTHALIWWATDDPRLSRAAYDAIVAPDSEVIVSAVSAYEMFYKRRLGKLGVVDALLDHLTGYLTKQLFAELPITMRHAEFAGSLPTPHRDPFDRFLIAQALCEELRLVSNEKPFDETGVRRLW